MKAEANLTTRYHGNVPLNSTIFAVAVPPAAVVVAVVVGAVLEAVVVVVVDGVDEVAGLGQRVTARLNVAPRLQMSSKARRVNWTLTKASYSGRVDSSG